MFPALYALFRKGAFGPLRQNRHRITYGRLLQAPKPQSGHYASVVPIDLDSFLRPVTLLVRIVLRIAHLSVIIFPFVLSWPLLYRFESGKNAWFHVLRKVFFDSSSILFFQSPVLLKLGQWASTRPDLISPDWIAFLSGLHHNAPSHPFTDTIKAVEASFPGYSHKDIFEYINEIPLGSGTIAQVHEACLTPAAYDLFVNREMALKCCEVEDSLYVQLENSKGRKSTGAEPISDGRSSVNRRVAIKILHPHIQDILVLDMAILSSLAYFLHNNSHVLQWYQLPSEVAQLSALMLSQTDLQREAANLAKFNYLFYSERDYVVFPKPYYPWVSRQVIVESFVPVSSTSDSSETPSRSSIDISHVLSMREFLKIDCEKNTWLMPLSRMIVTLGFDVFLKMMLLDNFTHADLHPGNLFVALYRRLPAKRPSAAGSSHEDVYNNFEALSQEIQSHWWDRARAYSWQQFPLLKFISQILFPINELNKDLPWAPFYADEVERIPFPISSIPEDGMDFAVLPDGGITAEQREFKHLVSRGLIEPKLIFLDVGLVTSLSADKFRNFLDLFKEIVILRDGFTAARLLIERAPGSVLNESLIHRKKGESESSLVGLIVKSMLPKGLYKHEDDDLPFSVPRKHGSGRAYETALEVYLKRLNPNVIDPLGFCNEIQGIIDTFFGKIGADIKKGASRHRSREELDAELASIHYELGLDKNSYGRSFKSGFKKAIPEEATPKAAAANSSEGDQLAALPLNAYHITPVLVKVLSLVRKHHIRLDDHYTNLIMSMIFVEGLGRRLCPSLDLLPFLRQAAFHYLFQSVSFARRG